MKHIQYLVLSSILLCCPAMQSQQTLTLSTDDVKFLSGCGVRQDDFKVIPKLESEGQERMSVILAAKKFECRAPDLRDFKETRDYVRKFTPPPSECPEGPAHYQLDFVTLAEREYINKLCTEIYERDHRNPQ